MLHTAYKVIVYTFAKQSYWYKLRGLHVYKAILLVQLRGLLFKLRRPRALQLSRGLLLGAYRLAGSRSPDGGGESHHFTGNRKPSPGRLPAPAPAAPHNKTYFSASTTNKTCLRPSAVDDSAGLRRWCGRSEGWEKDKSAFVMS